MDALHNFLNIAYPNTKVAKNTDLDLVKAVLALEKHTFIDGRNAVLKVMRGAEFLDLRERYVCSSDQLFHVPYFTPSDNCGLLLCQEGATEAHTGIALDQNNTWHHHWWCVADGKIIETTRLHRVYLSCSVSYLHISQPIITAKKTENTLAICNIYDHKTGTSLTDTVLGDDANNIMISRLETTHPECADEIKRRSKNKEVFVSYVYPQSGTELIFSYMIVPLDRYLDEYGYYESDNISISDIINDLIKKLESIGRSFLIFDLIYPADVKRHRFVCNSPSEGYNFANIGKTQKRVFNQFEYSMESINAYKLDILAEAPHFMNEQLSVFLNYHFKGDGGYIQHDVLVSLVPLLRL